MTIRSAIRETVMLPLAEAQTDFSPANNRRDPQVVDDAAVFVGLSGTTSTMQ